jgi:hypothetical protein
MKIQKGKMLIQDMGLVKGDLVQLGTGKNAPVMRYTGIIKRGGKIYDRLTPVDSHSPVVTGCGTASYRIVPSLHTKKKQDKTLLFTSDSARDAFLLGIKWSEDYYDPIDIQYGNIPKGRLEGVPFVTPGS